MLIYTNINNRSFRRNIAPKSLHRIRIFATDSTTMISISNISVLFGGEELFKDISFVINPKDRIGLVGKNGAGKSTLMNIIAGTRIPDKGKVDIQDGKTIGYLPQEIKVNSTKTILEETLSVFDEAERLEREIEDINKQLEERTDYESDSYADIITRLSDCHERLSLLDGGKRESQVEKVLLGLGFSRKDFERPISQFSGGWQMRVELAKLLLMKPSLMLLDEPTNHLDISSIMWLETFFKEYPGAIMMVSHDRMFLDEITNRTVELVFGKMHDYKASYTQYFELRAERLQQQEAAYNNQQKHIAQQEKFIERFKAKASKAKAAQSKQKQLDKIERVAFDTLDTNSIKFRFPPAPRSGDIVYRSKNLSKSYGDLNVLKDLRFEIQRGERLAFVGKNGEGKTTLVRLITGQETFDGEASIGHNVEIGYYAQIQESTLEAELTVYETLENIATDEWRNISRLRGLLGAFLFGAEDIDKKTKVLSGGEKSRLALAKLLLRPVNLLILDEPTNHLDISAKEVLKQALMDYNGTMIIVSHDRDFLSGLSDRTFEFTNKSIKEHLGDISEFLGSHEADNFREFELDNKKKPAKAAPAPKKEQSNEALSYEQRKEQEKEIRQLKKSLNRFERKIGEIEKEVASLEEKMADPDFYANDSGSKDAFFQHSQLKKELDTILEQWEECGSRLEELTTD